MAASKRVKKLDSRSAVEIYKLKYGSGLNGKLTASSVSRMYGVSEKAIRDIWSGRTWQKETRHEDKPGFDDDDYDCKADSDAEKDPDSMCDETKHKGGAMSLQRNALSTQPNPDVFDFMVNQRVDSNLGYANNANFNSYGAFNSDTMWKGSMSEMQAKLIANSRPASSGSKDDMLMTPFYESRALMPHSQLGGIAKANTCAPDFVQAQSHTGSQIRDSPSNFMPTGLTSASLLTHPDYGRASRNPAHGEPSHGAHVASHSRPHNPSFPDPTPGVEGADSQ
eukprot:CAMPEP_0113679248 /NCGR_PEP_ID=MMETSP0038_2-20120614/10495_1 /TAXON_ID=2898 /ORGANISM="Cryptomonas paramecium" /LENGTH=279 /DNA_ID=CAMNT_0000597171 /DNA_START=57 /DNA_END=893 /DNA_ORIENTATION=- /assembly_acc=CAM_ASM_000170